MLQLLRQLGHLGTSTSKEVMFKFLIVVFKQKVYMLELSLLVFNISNRNDYRKKKNCNDHNIAGQVLLFCLA